MGINLDPNNIQFQVEKNQDTGKARLGIYAKNEDQVGYKIDSIAVKVLPKQKSFIQRVKEAILTAFSWKWVKMDSETIVNVKTLAEHTGLSPQHIRNAVKNRTKDNALQNGIQTQTSHNENIQVILDNPEGDASKFGFEGRDSGFIKPAGFDLRDRKDQYITASNLLTFKPDSALAINKQELNSFLGRLREKKTPKEEASVALKAALVDNPDWLKYAVHEYKIHLMPSEEYSEEVVRKIVDELRNNPDLRNQVAQFKVLLKNSEQQFPENFSEDEIEAPPRIVLYAESKEAAQAILDAMRKVFSDEDAKLYGCDVTPRLNFQVNELIFYAQGTSGIKDKARKLGIDDQFLEPDCIHFKGDFHLTI
jgi:hypothetical protein